LWNLATGNTVKSLSHESQVQSVAFSPDGKLLTAGSFNGIVLVWDVDTEEEVRRLP
jgi:WD40 repeat protein